MPHCRVVGRGVVGSGHQARWLTERDVADLVDLRAAIEAVEDGLRREAEGHVVPVEKTHGLWAGGHTVHALGAVDEAVGLVAVKAWAHTPGGATPLLSVWEAETGALVAVIEAFALGQLRTAATSAVATRWMAPAEADTMAVIGSGRQAAGQVAAVLQVRPVATVRAFSPTAEHVAAFVDRVRAARPDVRVIAAPSVEAATDGAAIVTTVTRAREPFLAVDALGPDVHVNAVGAITPERAELGPDVVARAAAVVVDSEPAARRLARELADVTELIQLSTIVAKGGVDVRRPAITLFKALGTGLADLSVAVVVLDRAHASDRGRPIPSPERVAPDLWSSP